MSIFYYISAFVIAASPIAVAAQAPSSVGAADADAAVLPYEYKSAFESYQPMADGGDASGIAWRAANDEVARIGGHAGAMRSEQATAAGAPGSKDSPAEWSPVTPHSRHSGNHGSHH